MIANCIKLIDEATIRAASDLIRDGEFGESDFQFDRLQQSVALQLWTADEDLSFVRDGSRIYPMRRLDLTFSSVVNVAFNRRGSATGNHPLGGIQWVKPSSIYISAYDGLTVALSVSNLQGTMQITDIVDHERTRQRHRSYLKRFTAALRRRLIDLDHPVRKSPMTPALKRRWLVNLVTLFVAGPAVSLFFFGVAWLLDRPHPLDVWFQLKAYLGVGAVAGVIACVAYFANATLTDAANRKRNANQSIPDDTSC